MEEHARNAARRVDTKDIEAMLICRAKACRSGCSACCCPSVFALLQRDASARGTLTPNHLGLSRIGCLCLAGSTAQQC